MCRNCTLYKDAELPVIGRSSVRVCMSCILSHANGPPAPSRHNGNKNDNPQSPRSSSGHPMAIRSNASLNDERWNNLSSPTSEVDSTDRSHTISSMSAYDYWCVHNGSDCVLINRSYVSQISCDIIVT